MIRHPIPILNEKNVCPMALKITEEVILSKSGLNRNESPSSTPGRVTERIHNISSMINSAGIIILEALSIPFSTPETITMCVNAMKAIVQPIGRRVLDENVSKAVVNSAVVFPAREPVIACQIYSKVQPETTE